MIDQQRLLELKRLRGHFAAFGASEKVKGVDAEIAKLREADRKAEEKAAKAEAEAEAEAAPPVVEAAVEPPVVERAVGPRPARSTRNR